MSTQTSTGQASMSAHFWHPSLFLTSMPPATPVVSLVVIFWICNTNMPDYQPCNSQILATHKVVVDTFRELYPVNGNASAPDAVLVGRYPEDTYYGGNPWPLCTLGCAELLYDAAAQFEQAGQISVDQYSLAFFQDIYPRAQEEVYDGDALMNITQAMRTYADGFVSAVELYLPQNGSISEQFNRTTGESTSASKLTWSFASFVTMAQRRGGQYPVSRGAESTLGNTTATQCEATSYNATGMYAPARAAGAPDVDESCTSEIVFAVSAPTEFGQNVYLVGNTSLLGGTLNNISAIILPMGTGNLTADASYWNVDIWLLAGESFEYQYVLQDTTEGATQGWIFENVTRTVQNTQRGSSQTILTQDVASFPMSG